jgi:hypothetical protein
VTTPITLASTVEGHVRFKQFLQMQSVRAGCQAVFLLSLTPTMTVWLNSPIGSAHWLVAAV